MSEPSTGSEQGVPSGEQLEQAQEELTDQLRDNAALGDIADATDGEVAGPPGQ